MSTPAITTYYENDHDRLDGLFREYQQLKRTDFTKARESFDHFSSGLKRHIKWEEEILFPLFEKKSGMADGPTAVMRNEHRLIVQFLEAIRLKVDAKNRETDGDEAMLLGVLGMHNQKEERILYPAIDRSLAEGEREGVFAAMEGIPEQR